VGQVLQQAETAVIRCLSLLTNGLMTSSSGLSAVVLGPPQIFRTLVDWWFAASRLEEELTSLKEPLVSASLSV